MLSVYTGENYTTTTIYGNCQGDWQVAYYPTDKYSREDIRTLETAFFNMGTEWEIYEKPSDCDENDIPQTPDDICGNRYYCYSDNPRKELAETLGCKPEQLIMYFCSGTYETVYEADADNPPLTTTARGEKNERD